MRADHRNTELSRMGLLAALALLFASALASRASSSSTLLLSQNRVGVSVTWRNQYDGSTGTGTAIPVSDVFGFFAFSDQANPEVFVKVLDFGPQVPLLLFYGGLTSLEYQLTFHNRCTGQDVLKSKAPGAFDGGADNASMMVGCPAGPALTPAEAAASGPPVLAVPVRSAAALLRRA